MTVVAKILVDFNFLLNYDCEVVPVVYTTFDVFKH